jgi:hypothetical protein
MSGGDRKALLNKRRYWRLSEYRWGSGVAKKKRRNVFFGAEEETQIVVLSSSLGRRDDDPFVQAA